MPQIELTDYEILNLIIPSIPSLSDKPTLHTVYIRPHTPKYPTENDSRSIFLVNVPIDSTPPHFRAIFASLIGPGRFESISFENENRIQSIQKHATSMTHSGQKRKRDPDSSVSLYHDLPELWDRNLRKSGSSATVLLVDEKSVGKMLKAVRRLRKGKNSTEKWPVWGEVLPSATPPLGSNRYLSHQKLRFPDPINLQQNIDSFMSEFNALEKDKREHEKKLRNEPDAEGFITVTRGGRAGPARKEIVEEKMAQIEERERKKREQMQKSGFYRYQGREKRKAEADELVRRFEEDKKSIQALREKKGKAGFRPEN